MHIYFISERVCVFAWWWRCGLVEWVWCRRRANQPARVQLQAHKGNVQERILALQVESEEAHMTIAALRKELGVIRADLKRRVTDLNGKVLEYDEHRQDICAAIQRQERELDRREAGVEQVTRNLELLMERIIDGERCQQQLLLNDQVRASRHTSVCCYICFCARMPRGGRNTGN